MNNRSFDLVVCRCRVTAPRPVLAQIEHYLVGFESPDELPADFHVLVGCDPPRVASASSAYATAAPDTTRWSHSEQCYDVWLESERQILLPNGDRDHVIVVSPDLIEIVADDLGLAATLAVRVVRQMVIRGAESRNGMAVHAGAVHIDGEAVLIGGAPGAGKTSTLTELVENHGAAPISNDRTMLIPGNDGSLTAVAVPLAWRFTPEGLRNPLTAAAERGQLARGPGPVDGKIEFTPLEISRHLGSGQVSNAQIGRLIVLVRSGHPPSPITTATLREHLGFGHLDQFAHDWLDLSRRFARDQQLAADPWSKLSDAVSTQVLTWTDPADLPLLACRIATWRSQ